jgi:hypothetical protein
MDPTQEESNKKETSEFIVFVDEILGCKTPDNIVKASKDVYGSGVELDDVVIMLCRILTNLNLEQQEAVIYNARSKTSRRLADWWEEHQKADTKRCEEEEAEERKVALAKLTPHEREILGLNKTI